MTYHSCPTQETAASEVRICPTGKNLALYQILYFTYEEDLETLARKLMEGDPRCRAGCAVPMAAPSGSGKTATSISEEYRDGGIEFHPLHSLQLHS